MIPLVSPRAALAAAGAGLLLAGVLLTAGCDGSDTVPAAGGGKAYFGSVKPARGQVFRFNNGPEPEMLDPGLMSGQPDGRIARSIFEGVVIPDPRTLEPMPGQAYRWDVSEDLRTYTFHLRPGLRWSNGDPVTAADFEWSWKRVLDPAAGSRYASFLYPVENGREFHQGEITDRSRIGIRAPDDSTLIVQLANPTPYFLFSLTFYTFLPVHRPTVERYGDRWSRAENLVCNGPFLIEKHEPGAYFELVRNPSYWNAAQVRLDRITAYSVEELNTSTNLYKAGVIDWNPSGYVPAPYLPFMKQYADFHSEPYQAVYYYSINATQPPFDDVWVRRALAAALDRETIVAKVLRGTRIPWGNFTPTGYLGYEHPEPQRFDPEYARECLRRAGYPGGKGFPGADILFNTSEDHRRIAEAIQAMWAEHLNVRITLSNQEWASYLNATTSLQYQIARRSWIGDYPDPSTFLNCFRTGDGNNRTGWSNAAYDRLMQASESEPDRGRRLEMLAEAEAILLDEAVVLPIYHYVSTTLLKPHVRGLYPTSLDVHPLQFVWIDHRWRDAPTEPVQAAIERRGAPR